MNKPTHVWFAVACPKRLPGAEPVNLNGMIEGVNTIARFWQDNWFDFYIGKNSVSY